MRRVPRRANPILEAGGFGSFDENGMGGPAVWAADWIYWMLGTAMWGPGANCIDHGSRLELDEVPRSDSATSRQSGFGSAAAYTDE